MASESLPLSTQDKEAALDRLLASQVLARSPQLRAFLKYVCVAEMEGRGAALNEYLVGVEALGRPPQFSPTEDTIVRNRAHALRQRLDDYYRTEGAADALRIELPRGSYCPRFLFQPAPAAAPAFVSSVAAASGLSSSSASFAGSASSASSESSVSTASTASTASSPGAVPSPSSSSASSAPDHALVPAADTGPQVVSRAASVPVTAAIVLSEPAPDTRWRGARVWAIWPALVGAVVGAALAVLWLSGEQSTAADGGAGRGGSSAPSRLVSMFWGPLVEANADVLVCVAAPGQAMLRAIDGPPPARMWEPIPRLEQWFRETSPSPVPSSARVYVYPYWSSPFWGDAVGAMTVVPVLARAGVSYSTMPERVLTLPATRGRNLVVVGNPEVSLIARHYLASTPYTIGYDPAQRDWGIVPTSGHPRGSAGPRFFPTSGQNGVSRTYGLLTIVPSEGTVAQERRTLLISGLGSSGTQAAAEFVASDAELAILADHLQRDGHSRPPAAYQVVVEATTTTSLPLTVRYHTHIVVPAR